MERCSESQVPILEDSSSGVKMSSSSSSSLTSSSDGKGKRNSGNFYLGDDEEENKRNQILAHLTDPNESPKKDDVHCNKLKDEHELLLPIPAINCVNTDGEIVKGNGYLRHGDGSPRHSHGEFDGKSVPMRTIHSTASISRHHQVQTLTLPCDNWRNSAEEALLAKQAIAILRRGETTPNSIYPHPHIITHSQSYHLGNHSHNVSPHSCNSSHFGNRRHHPKSSSAGATRALEEADKAYSKRAGNNALGLVLSALYGKILVVMGIAFPMSEVISTYIPPSFYDGFYLYLYFGSITFMICILGNILRERATKSVRGTIKRISTMRSRLAPGNAGIAPDVTTTERQEHSCESEGSFSESPLPSGIDSAVARAKLNRLSRVGSENGIDPLNLDDLGMLSTSEIHFGSFYLRMGAVAFGIGSMIYSGLEFGQYFELEPDTKCHNVLIALTPSVRMIFTFMQMYFVFLNSKIDVNKVRLGAQFGLMHMIGTNLCVWLNVLIQETRHEILQFYNPDNNTVNIHHGTQLSAHKPHGRGTLSGAHQGHPVKHGGGHGGGHGVPTHKPTLMATAAAITTTTAKLPHVVPKIATATSKSKLLASIVPTVAATTSKTIATVAPTMAVVTLRNVTEVVANATTSAVNSTVTTILQRERRGLKGPHSIYECRRTDIMGALVQNASPFMFPCTIEYSLICAAILYVMWKSMARPRKHFPRTASIYHQGEFHLIAGAKRSPHYYSVDCARANKGLFLGIFVLVLTIISLILFFVLITRRDYEALALLEVNITELVLYTTTTVAVLIGMCQVRELRYDCRRNLELDNILLIVAQTGSFIYNVFTIIGGHFTMKKNSVLVLMTALASLVQLLFQTIFILDASKRVVATADQVRRKPGREVITFLLVTNLAMWAINTLEKSRADSHPVQLRFYGVWAWTIITHISMPLAIFYRFHSTVCLCEIWKRAYKIKHSPNFISL